jgi:hypothetical protein
MVAMIANPGSLGLADQRRAKLILAMRHGGKAT